MKRNFYKLKMILTEDDPLIPNNIGIVSNISVASDNRQIIDQVMYRQFLQWVYKEFNLLRCRFVLLIDIINTFWFKISKNCSHIQTDCKNNFNHASYTSSCFCWKVIFWIQHYLINIGVVEQNMSETFVLVHEIVWNIFDL